MNCEDYQELLVAFNDQELIAPEEEKVKAHLSGCRTCQEELEQIRQFAQRMHNATDPFRASTQRLSAKINVQLTHRSISFARFQWVGIAAAIVVVAAFFYLRWSAGNSEELANWGIQHYELVDQTHPVTGNAQTVKAWFQEHHNLAVIPPQQIDYTHLSGCKMAEFRSQPVPLLRLEEKPVKAVFILPESANIGFRRSYMKDGFQITFWKEQDRFYMSLAKSTV